MHRLALLLLLAGCATPDEPRADYWYFDGDGDGFIGFDPSEILDTDERITEQVGSPGANWVASEDAWNNPQDCDDDDDTVFPGADEVCDGKDNDCSGGIDDADECVSWTGDWSLTLVGAETTGSFDLGSASDFLVRVELDDVAIIVTPAVQDNEAPVWNRTESITVTSSSVLEVVLLDEDSDGFGGSVNELIAEWSLSGSSLGAFLEANGTHQLDAANSNTWVTFQTTPL